MGDQAFKIKSVPEGISTTLFGWLTPEYIKIEQPQVEQLKQQGYEMDAWLQGELLRFNYKSTDKTGWKKFKEGAL